MFADAPTALGRTRFVKVLALAAAVLTVSGSAALELPKSFENRREGISLRYPRGWSATAKPLTQVDSPVQIAAVASFSLAQRGRDTNCFPRRAFAKVQPRGAFIFVIEYRAVARTRDFPRRPRRFALPRRPENYECFPGTYMLRFRDQHRYCQIHVALGRNATRVTRRFVLAVLDSLVVRRLPTR